MLLKGNNIYDWIQNHRLYHLCLEDVQKMNVGDIFDVAIFDTNMEEYGMWNKIPGNTYIAPEEIFQFNHHKIKYLGNLTWEIILNGESFEHPVHFNVDN